MDPQAERPLSPERFRILAFDGGPSATVMIRILRRMEEQMPGFLERVDMFSGTSNGAIISLYLAHALNQGKSSREAIEGCIAFERELIHAFKLTLKGVLRLASLSLSMQDGQALRELFQKHFGDTRLTDLKKPMISATAFNASQWHRAVFHSFDNEQENAPTLVDVALASSALMPLVPGFRMKSSVGRNKSGDLLLDGALTENSTMLSALSDALEFLCRQEKAGDEPVVAAQRGYLTNAHRYLPRIRLLSMGSKDRRVELPYDVGFTGLMDRVKQLIRDARRGDDFFEHGPLYNLYTLLVDRLYCLKWPPLGLQKDDELFEYGIFWVLAANLETALALIERQAQDNDRFLRKLLGEQRFHRVGATLPSIQYVWGMMVNPDKLLDDAARHADRLWEHLILRSEGLPVPGLLTAEKSAEEKDLAFLNWARKSWMEEPVDSRPLSTVG